MQFLSLALAVFVGSLAAKAVAFVVYRLYKGSNNVIMPYRIAQHSKAEHRPAAQIPSQELS